MGFHCLYLKGNFSFHGSAMSYAEVKTWSVVLFNGSQEEGLEENKYSQTLV
jgi:hypothetical protein